MERELKTTCLRQVDIAYLEVRIITKKKFRLPSEIPLKEYPPPSTFVKEAVSCVEDAERQGLMLRVMGGLAIFLHCQNRQKLWSELGRLGKRVFTDIDFASYRRFGNRLTAFFESRGYTLYRVGLYTRAKERQIYFGGSVPMVEVFFDRLRMNHTIEFANRLEIDSPTIPLAELLLEKLQIVHMNEKDIKDAIVLLVAHDVADSDEETINAGYISKILAKDWGFYYTVMTNLGKIKEAARKYDVITKSDFKIIDERIGRLIKRIKDEPKTLRWRLRAKVGPKKRWYEEVEEWH